MNKLQDHNLYNIIKKKNKMKLNVNGLMEKVPLFYVQNVMLKSIITRLKKLYTLTQIIT